MPRKKRQKQSWVSSVHLELLAVGLAAVSVSARGEADLVAAHLAFQRERLAFGAQRAGEHLELLLQRQLALRDLVRAGDAGGDDPEEGGAPGTVAALHQGGLLVLLPVAHGERVRDD